MTHTPGPWHVQYGENAGYDCMTGAFDITARNQIQTSVDLRWYGQQPCQPPTPATMAIAEANARLIAAAPDLLAALEMVLEDAPTRLVMDAGNEIIIRATIKKARGE